MREVSSAKIEECVCQLVLAAHFSPNRDLVQGIQQAIDSETTPQAKEILRQIEDNYRIAHREQCPICQDCGMTLIYMDVGQEVHISGDLESSVNAGVRRAYKEGYLRASVVKDPLFDRANTQDGTPAILHVRLVPGEQIRLTAVAKGFGSENCSRLRLFIPATPLEEIKAYIVDTALEAGAKSCPPLIVGVGIGGTMDKAAQLAKTATFRELTKRNPIQEYGQLEQELLERINASGIGPGGLGGHTTALAVNIETFATHIASIPVAVNMCCHAARHASVLL